MTNVLNTPVADIQPKAGLERVLNIIRPYISAALAALVFLAFIVDTVNQSTALNENHLVYGLDDAYIHMSIARNFAEHGVWGITPYAYSSTTSSPLWTLMIAVVYVFSGVNEWVPLLLNILMGILVLLAANHLLIHFRVAAIYRLIVLMTLVVLVPFNTLALSGMEHLLQILGCLLLINSTLNALQSTTLTPSSLRYWFVPVSAMLVATTRYEGLMMVACVCVVFLLWKRPVYAIITGIFAAVPVVVYGLIAIGNGWQFLPASISVKSGAFSYLMNVDWQARFTFLVADSYQIFSSEHILTLPLLAALALCLYRYEKLRTLRDNGLVLLLIFAVTTVLTVRLVSWPDPGTFSRYEAFLVALSIIVIPAVVGLWLPSRISLQGVPILAVGIVLILFLINDLYNRYVYIAYDRPIITATTEIYRQQYQMGRFLQTYYNDATIATNDIGAVNYFTDIKNVDMWGLGTVEVTRAKADNIYTPAVMHEIASSAGVQLAIVYDDWLALYGGVPEEWILVERWHTEMAPVILGNATVSFYVLDEADVLPLQQNLEEFAPSLPDKMTRLN